MRDRVTLAICPTSAAASGATKAGPASCGGQFTRTFRTRNSRLVDLWRSCRLWGGARSVVGTDAVVDTVAVMSESPQRRGRLLPWRQFPTERDWKSSLVLEPRLVPYEPELISDGAGLPFAPSAINGPAGQLDPVDPPVGALAAQLSQQKPAADGSMPRLQDWRILARAENEVLFGKGLPPHMITVTMRREGRRNNWSSVAVTRSKPLRTTRDGIRASSWQLDPTQQLNPEDTIIRMLVTEQTRSGGELAHKRLLAPDLHDGHDELVLTMFVAPKPGVGMPSGTLETPVRVRLPSAVGDRLLVDGALYQPT
jgi:hypothetical protein